MIDDMREIRGFLFNIAAGLIFFFGLALPCHAIEITGVSISPESPAHGEDVSMTIRASDPAGVKWIRIEIAELKKSKPCDGSPSCVFEITRKIPASLAGPLIIKIAAESASGDRAYATKVIKPGSGNGAPQAQGAVPGGTSEVKGYKGRISTPSGGRIGADYVWYGINQYTNQKYVPVLAEYMSDLKIKFLRVDVMWHLLEPREGKIDWAMTDAIVNAMPPDVEILFTLYSSARWAIKGGGAEMEKKPRYTSAHPKKIEDYYGFVYAMASRYKGRIKYYQIENEVYDAPNHFWNGTKEEYLGLFKAGSAAIRKADPEAKVLPASIALSNVDINLAKVGAIPKYRDTADFIDYVFTNGCNLFDIADLHLYYTLDSIPERLEWLREFLAKKNCVKPVWVTETGGLDPKAYKNTGDDRLQAEDLVKRFTLIFGNGAERASWLHIHKTKDSGDTLWGPMRLVNDAYAKEMKPAYYALKQLIGKIDGFTAVESVPGGYRFMVKGKAVLVLWSDAPRKADISAYIKTPEARISHIVTAVRDNGPVYLSDEVTSSSKVYLSREPVFVQEVEK